MYINKERVYAKINTQNKQEKKQITTPACTRAYNLLDYTGLHGHVSCPNIKQ